MRGMMGLKKKKNIIILTLCMVVCFTLYQLYFFLTITSENDNNNKVIRVEPVSLDHEKLETFPHLRSEADMFINLNGIIHGVLYTHMSKYRPDHKNEFKCLKTERRIPFEQVNDDYCDCDDGSDEPSTSACHNGTFYCQTQYRNKQISFNVVPSSQVNDGICDCCDGSDEWKHDLGKKLLSQSSSKFYRYYVSVCPNNCK